MRFYCYIVFQRRNKFLHILHIEEFVLIFNELQMTTSVGNESTSSANMSCAKKDTMSISEGLQSEILSTDLSEKLFQPFKGKRRWQEVAFNMKDTQEIEGNQSEEPIRKRSKRSNSRLFNNRKRRKRQVSKNI